MFHELSKSKKRDKETKTNKNVCAIVCNTQIKKFIKRCKRKKNSAEIMNICNNYKNKTKNIIEYLN